tara:strand:+ start:646 stop:822 length:177 start_codon:yes stop_codon:yes gene_type:complete
MKRYTKDLQENEVDEFFKLFGDRKKKYKFILQHREGKIINCETEDSKIIKFVKEKGLK